MAPPARTNLPDDPYLLVKLRVQMKDCLDKIKLSQRARLLGGVDPDFLDNFCFNMSEWVTMLYSMP